MLNRIVTSTNEDKTYLEFWKLQLLSTRAFFPDKKLTIAFYTDRTDDDELVKEMRREGIDVRLYKIIPNHPEGNVAKILRYICASEFGDEVCISVDMDTIPLQSEYINRITSVRQPGKMLGVGKEVLDGTEHAGKFPAHHMCAEGYVFKKLYNPQDKPLKELLDDLSGSRMFDNKEDIDGHPFSDESLNRALISKNSVDMHHITRDINISSDWLDRSWWGMNLEKLHSGKYIEANLLRPWSNYTEKIKPVYDYLKSLTDEKY
jgi:hypothetical protein